MPKLSPKDYLIDCIHRLWHTDRSVTLLLKCHILAWLLSFALFLTNGYSFLKLCLLIHFISYIALLIWLDIEQQSFLFYLTAVSVGIILPLLLYLPPQLSH